MSGWICNKIAQSFDDAITSVSWENIPRKPLGPSEVRVKVAAFGLNFFDLLAMCGRYQIKFTPPFSPCNEGAGVVIETGSDVKDWKKGDEVILTFVGSIAREEVVVESHLLLRKPKRLNFLEAAGIFVGWATAWHGLVQRGNLQRGEVLLVTGAAGGMGLLAVQIGVEMGCKVVGVVSSEKKKLIVEKAGAKAVVLPPESATGREKETSGALKEALSEYGGCDVCYEVVGGPMFSACNRVMNSSGRLLVIGFAGGVIGTVQANLALVKGFSIVGVRSGAELLLHPQLMQDALRACDQSKITPVLDVFPNARFKEALTKMAKREAVGKIVVDLSLSAAKL